MRFINLYKCKKTLRFFIAHTLLITALTLSARAQNTDETAVVRNLPETGVSDRVENYEVGQNFRVEKIRVAGGSELITIFADLKGENNQIGADVPLVSVLRDTLGDKMPENDRLRYVWMLNYKKPSLAKRIVSGIPFFYGKVWDEGKVGSEPPPAILDLNRSDKDMWDSIFWLAFKNIVLSDFDPAVRAPALQLKGNRANYRQSATMRALAVLTLYESLEGEKILSETELQDIQARALLSDKMTGAFVSPENLGRVYQKNIEKTRGFRGQNWELLRQYSEAQQLYFEPLEMPDGSATHAIIWIDEADLALNKNKEFDSRFLNIKNPWKDERLTKWSGYKETRYYNEENREVAPETPNAKPKTLIPLALYSLDNPKIPAILIDFRNARNAKMREISKRLLNDVTRNVLSLSKFGNIPYFVGSYLYDFVMARRGIDFNQPSRFRAYSQLKLLLLLDESLDQDFKKDISARLEKISANPLENDSEAEIRIARRQYQNLLEYARRPNGLPKKIENDRREEMVRLNHSAKERMFYAAAHFFSFGIYTRCEKPTTQLLDAMNLRRQLEFHERILRETAQNSARPEIDSNLEAVKKSLAFVTEYGGAAESKTVKAISKIFLLSENEEVRRLALSGLNKIESPAAKKQLLALYENQRLEIVWRNVCAAYLKVSPVEDKPQISLNGAN